MSIIADGIRHRKLVIAAGDREIKVFTARSDPSARDMKADMFADFGLCDVIDDKHVIVGRTEWGGEYYTGVIPHDLQPQEYPARLSDLSFTILKDAGQRGCSSLWLNFSDGPSWRDLPSTFTDYLGFMEGIKRYAVSVEDEKPQSHISGIVIGCGVATYGILQSSLDEAQNLARLRAIIPAHMIRILT